jgi:ribosomal protein S18 acetylase RimI-like enzyme
MIIRPAASADLPVAARLAVAERGGEHAQWQARFAADLTDPDACLLLAETGGQVTAYGRARRFDPPPGAPAGTAPAGYYLTGVLVAPGYRRPNRAPAFPSTAAASAGTSAALAPSISPVWPIAGMPVRWRWPPQ